MPGPIRRQPRKIIFASSIHGVKGEIFGGLVRNPLTTANSFLTDATNIQRALWARASHYHRLAGVHVPPTVASSRMNLNTSGSTASGKSSATSSGISFARCYLLLIAHPLYHSPKSCQRRFTEPFSRRLLSPYQHRRSPLLITLQWSNEHHQPRAHIWRPPEAGFPTRSIPDARKIERTYAENNLCQQRPTCGKRPTDAYSCSATTAGKPTTSIVDWMPLPPTWAPWVPPE